MISPAMEATMMTGRERVKATLTFNHPDRVPRDLWALPYIILFRKDEFDALVEEYPLDIGATQLSPGQSQEVVAVTATAGHYKDAWGSVWYVGEPGVVGEVKEPVLADWSQLDKFQPPWETIRGRDFMHVNQTCAQSDQFMLSDVTARPFERLQFLRGSTNLFVDIAYNTAEMRKLLDMVHEFYLEDIRGWCKTEVDGIVFMDDWGTNHSLLIKPAVWRELFKPLYRDYCNLIHAAGKFAFFHSDGHTTAIYPDLIEAGIDAINSQLFTMDIEQLARQYKGKITFWGEIDRQHVLPFGTPEDVKEAVYRVRRALDSGAGGVIAQCEWGKDNPKENISAVFNAWSDPLPALHGENN
jgi:uroporphyrinogen decarboxylase